MAQIFKPTKAQVKEWRQWVKELPPVARAVAERFNPWTLYRLKDTGLRATFYSVADDGTLTVIVSGDFNAVMFERRVFGIPADDLEECDLPIPGEPLGAVLSQEQAAENIEALRVMVRPDLWEMGEDGKATRKH